MRLTLKNTVALNLWNDGGVHAEMKITSLSTKKVYSSFECKTADRIHEEETDDDVVEVGIEGEREKLLIELYHVHIREGTSYVGRTVIPISKEDIAKAKSNGNISRTRTFKLERGDELKKSNVEYEQYIRTQLILVPTIPVEFSMITCHDLKSTLFDRYRDIYVVGRVSLGNRIIKAERASFMTGTTWNYREGKALRFQGDETKTSLHLTYEELSDADLVLFVKDRGMFDRSDSFEDDGEIIGMGVVSLKTKLKQGIESRVSVRLCEESGDHIDTTCDFNVSCRFLQNEGGKTSDTHTKKGNTIKALGRVGKAEFMRAFLDVGDVLKYRF